MKKIFYSIFAATCLLFAACAKEPVVGPQGAAGTNGVDGNMKIITKVLNIASSEWTFAGTNGSTSARYIYTRSLSDITPNITTNGTVLLYYKTAAGDWFSLPHTFYQSGYNYTISYGYQDYELTMLRYDSDLGPVNPGAWEVKVVIIPGAAKTNVNYGDYNAVKAAYHLAD